MKKCVFCGQEVDDNNGIGRRDECVKCSGDLHCCLQCIFHDPAYHNQCRETQAEMVVEKDRSNFCGYFQFGRDEQEQTSTKFKVKASLEKLFKK
jgi:hypothetical protein